jgi:hypothetical protein
VPVGITIALALAFLVDSFTPRWEKFFRGMYFFPVIIPMFLSAVIFRYLLSPSIRRCSKKRSVRSSLERKHDKGKAPMDGALPGYGELFYCHPETG